MRWSSVPAMVYPAIVQQQWLAMVLYLAEWYASLLDPRPDLSIPARSTRFPYAWWW